MKASKLALCIVCVTLVSACSQKPKPPPPTVASITMQTSPGVNPDVDGRPSPIVSRLYYLAALDPFSTLGFFELFERDEALLGDTLLARQEIQMGVGEQRSFTRTVNDRVRYIGVIGAYRDIERARWRAVLEILPNRSTALVVDFTSDTVSIGVR